jgi:hypothetical protein
MVVILVTVLTVALVLAGAAVLLKAPPVFAEAAQAKVGSYRSRPHRRLVALLRMRPKAVPVAVAALAGQAGPGLLAARETLIPAAKLFRPGGVT